jgi:hypothetical protein
MLSKKWLTSAECDAKGFALLCDNENIFLGCAQACANWNCEYVRIVKQLVQQSEEI